MTIRKLQLACIASALSLASLALAGDDPVEHRHELMESTGKAAKPIGQMLKGEAAFDASVVKASLETFSEVGASFGDLFPAGSENGKDSKAAPAIWEDRAGFDAALAKWQDAVAAAIDAAPATVEDTKAALGPVFNACKGCHDSYRLEDD